MSLKPVDEDSRAVYFPGTPAALGDVSSGSRCLPEYTWS